MASVVYEYTFTKPRKDGTMGVYKKHIVYTKKAKKEFNSEEIAEIKRRLADGVSKKRICEDYKITFGRLQKIIV